MAAVLKPYEAQAYAVFRIVFGLLFLCHGAQNVFGFPGERPAAPAAVIWTAGPIELVGGLLIALGLATRWAALLASGLMAAAYWMAHGLRAPLPIQNHGELAVLYCFAFLYMAARGGGAWSVDGEGVDGEG